MFQRPTEQTKQLIETEITTEPVIFHLPKKQTNQLTEKKLETASIFVQPKMDGSHRLAKVIKCIDNRKIDDVQLMLKQYPNLLFMKGDFTIDRAIPGHVEHIHNNFVKYSPLEFALYNQDRDMIQMMKNCVYETHDAEKIKQFDDAVVNSFTTLHTYQDHRRDHVEAITNIMKKAKAAKKIGQTPKAFFADPEVKQIIEEFKNLFGSRKIENEASSPIISALMQYTYAYGRYYYPIIEHQIAVAEDEADDYDYDADHRYDAAAAAADDEDEYYGDVPVVEDVDFEVLQRIWKEFIVYLAAQLPKYYYDKYKEVNPNIEKAFIHQIKNDDRDEDERDICHAPAFQDKRFSKIYHREHNELLSLVRKLATSGYHEKNRCTIL